MNSVCITPFLIVFTYHAVSLGFGDRALDLDPRIDGSRPGEGVRVVFLDRNFTPLCLSPGVPVTKC